MAKKTMKQSDAIARGHTLADELSHTYSVAHTCNSERIRAALLEGLMISVDEARLTFEACDERLEKDGFRMIQSGERARARRIIKGAESDTLRPKLVEMLEAGNSLQDVSEECPKVSTRGRKSGKGAGKRPSEVTDATDDVKDATESAAPAMSEAAVQAWILTQAPAVAVRMMRACIDRAIASVKVPDNRVKVDEHAKGIAEIFGLK
jgi:hypothetical protein